MKANIVIVHMPYLSSYTFYTLKLQYTLSYTKVEFGILETAIGKEQKF